ncbi:hypothetical protein EW145_g3623 [Phellinidium pouzarii]|uniref:MYND-type domain-containing protein n=1 Tax=Phellinidium pouzarii TaxID=167371 RepID=A0A4S4LBQ9_9AGAM|nr:hypothetical protein EW145_g3623 [Phellinidium pouzarii]
MVLDVYTLSLGRKDLEAGARGGGILVHKTEYVRVTQYNYARITPESPGKGACTDHVASCTVVVLHCPTTGRTTLSHSPNFMYMTTFIPLIDWVTGGPGKEDLSMDEQVAFCDGKDSRPCALEAHIMRGFAYASPGASKFNHAGWIKDFREFFGMVARARRISLHIEDSERLLSSGAVLVDKGTGKITHVELALDALAVVPSLRTAITLEFPALAGQYTIAQEHQDLFVGALLNAQNTPEPTPLRLQFDARTYCLPHPLSDEARQLLRSKRLGGPPAEQSAIIQRFGKSDDWISKVTGTYGASPEFRLLRSLLASAAVDRPCELCALEGTKTCSACMGAWYCGDAHQRRDWKAHKSWCRQHLYEEGRT